MFAVVAGFAAGTLTLTGNFQNDTIVLNDNGAGLVNGSANNGFGVMIPFAFAGVNRVVINAGAGNDTVRYNFSNDVLGYHQVQAWMGTGNDSFNLTAQNDIDILGNCTLEARVFGEAGDDKLAIFHRGEVDGTQYLTLDGGDGQDTLVHDIHLDAGSSGYCYARSLGQMGDDKQQLLVRKAVVADPIAINAVASGGAGFDNLTRTPWAFNDATCEVVAVIP
jgi:hypothetical protein